MTHDDDGETMLPLAMELITASAGDEEEFFRYVLRRLREDVKRNTDVVELVARLAAFARAAFEEWAASDGRDPEEILRAVAMNIAQEGADE